MKRTTDFFQGSIAQDFQAILDADALPHSPARVAAGGKKPASGKPGCKAEKPKTGQYCKPQKETDAPPCTGKGCKTPKKTDAFQPSVPGWSSPPAPLAF